MAKCHLVDPSGWGQQLGLGLLAFLILVYKRFQEVPQRPWKIWSFDTSKQAIVSAEIHFINVGLARAMMKTEHTDDSCGWYFTMVLLDSTIGLVTVYWLLRWSEWWVHRHQIEPLYSGDYGTPPSWRPWFAQLLLYNTVMLVEKGLVSLLLLIPFVQMVGKGILSPIGQVSATFEQMVALVIAPFMINVMWFWIVDNILMKGEQTGQGSGGYSFRALRAEVPTGAVSPLSSRGGSVDGAELLLDVDGDSSELDDYADYSADASYSGDYKPYRRHHSPA